MSLFHRTAQDLVANATVALNIVLYLVFVSRFSAGEMARSIFGIVWWGSVVPYKNYMILGYSCSFYQEF
jgi:hypothetical protein